MIKRLHPFHVGRDVGQQHATTQAVLLDPGDVFDGVIDVIQEELFDTGALLGLASTEIDEPPVVRVDAGATVGMDQGPVLDPLTVRCRSSGRQPHR